MRGGGKAMILAPRGENYVGVIHHPKQPDKELALAEWQPNGDSLTDKSLDLMERKLEGAGQ